MGLFLGRRITRAASRVLLHDQSSPPHARARTIESQHMTCAKNALRASCGILIFSFSVELTKSDQLQNEAQRLDPTNSESNSAMAPDFLLMRPPSERKFLLRSAAIQRPVNSF